ncbi:unnamed protein product [Phytophthora fragariaefolia]|uniref:Unnamed protein product n=1 Tax=Phytophthora fragariaefolia TaxID=1490495 RepID=A0A9W6TQN8_9STRA|nr:unnamed protein product [Phytophthora fragariaefolia]
MQQQYPSKAQQQEDEELPDSMELVEDEDEHDDGEDPDEETEKFLDEAEELFRLSPTEFQKRMDTFDQRHAHEADEDDEEDPDDIDRAMERIPKTKLLKVLGELNPNSAPMGKNAERMPNPGLSTLRSLVVPFRLEVLMGLSPCYCRNQEHGTAREKAQAAQG